MTSSEGGCQLDRPFESGFEATSGISMAIYHHVGKIHRACLEHMYAHGHTDASNLSTNCTNNRVTTNVQSSCTKRTANNDQ